MMPGRARCRFYANTAGFWGGLEREKGLALTKAEEVTDPPLVQMFSDAPTVEVVR